MSGDAGRKKKDRRRKKANIEQLQKEEHQEERTRILHIEDDDDDVVFRPSRAQRQDEEALLEQRKDGSGWCVKLVFLILIGALGLAIGVVFLEIDANKDLSSIVADSTAKVSSVIQDTGDAVSSLWKEHGSSVSEIFETVKQSIGLEGAPSEQKAPLEDLADKKDKENALYRLVYTKLSQLLPLPRDRWLPNDISDDRREPVETAQVIEESEEFFDEGEELIDEVPAGLPVEAPAGDVAPEPVRPADSYDLPEVEVEQASATVVEEEVAESKEEDEVVPEIVEEAPEDFVSTPVENPEEAQSVPEESQEVEEDIPEVVEDAPDDVVSTPVESPEEAQSVPEASQEVEESVPEVEEPVPEAEEPVPEVEEPVPEVEESVPEVEEPVPEAEEPVLEVDEPVQEIDEPVQEIEEPVPEVEELVPEVEEPVPEVEEPVPEVEEPVPEVEEPIPEAEEPIPEAEEVVPEVVEDAPEDVVSTSVENPEEDEYYPTESEEALEDVGEVLEDIFSTLAGFTEEAQSVPEDSQEEVQEEIVENVVSTPVDSPLEAQSVPEEVLQAHDVVEEVLEAASAEEAEEPVSTEDEPAPEESEEEIQEEIVENVVSTPVDSPLEAQSVPEEVLETHNIVDEVIEAAEEPVSAEDPEVVSESQEEIIEDVVSVPVDSPQEAQSLPEEVLQTDDIVEEIVEAAAASVEEQMPEVQYDAADDMVSAPAVEQPEQVQSVPESVVEERQDTFYGDSYGEPVQDAAPEPSSAENEVSQEEVEEEEVADAEKAAYSKIDITNDADFEIREELDAAEEALSQSALEALSKFEDILRAHPNSPRALYGRAMALDKLSERERSNSRLEQAIFAYRNVLDLEQEVPDALYRLAGTRVVERMKFRGFQGKAIRTQQRLILRFPDDLTLRNELVVIYLTVGHNDAAKELLEDILKTWPDSGFAKVHYGFVLKNIDKKMEEGAKYLQEGIDSREEGTLDGRFFYHLGDAYERLGRRADAEKVYEEAEKLGLFRSRHQRSLYNVDRLQSKPFWTKEETTYEAFLSKLEDNWETIRDEGLSLMNLTPPEGFKDEAESLRDTGDWKQYELFARGRKLPGCAKAPKTCALLDSFPPASSCKRGQSKFSVMHPGTHVWPHTGPTNCRLRAHLGLKVPENVTIRVVDQTRNWEEGKVFIFDDSYDHEVWHNGTSFRLVLIVDLWHPDLTESERQTLPAI